MKTRYISLTQKWHFRILIVLVQSVLISCEDFLIIDNPKTELASEDVFENDLTARSAIANIYAQMSLESGGLNSITYLAALSADESHLFSNDLNANEIYTNNITVTNSAALTFWGASGYAYIYQANSILEGLQKSQMVTPDIKTQLEGEAVFLRAFLHFYLANLFGDVPYITSTDYRSNTVAPQVPKKSVYELIIQDLKDAQNRLPENFDLAGSERIRPTKWAATALLARTYLYNGNWDLAESESTVLINNQTLFSLPTLDEVFLKNSSEAIWQLKPLAASRNTNEGNIFILTGTPRYSALTTELINSFENGDLRRQKWIGEMTVGENTWYYPYKYKIQNGATPLEEYSMVLRLAEQYLIRAEARCMQNNLPAAISDIDIIRQRSNLPLIAAENPSISKNDLLIAIEQERRNELFTEWGHRWLDLKRTDRADPILSAIKPGWQSTDILYPIPQSEVLVNPNIEQNLGY